MRIKGLTIKNFGKIHDKEIKLSPGINVLYGENESGKTTVHTFIKSMLYGITRMRGRAAKNDNYAKYEPWENSAVYGGTLWFEIDGRTYRLSRNFHKENPSSEFLCEDSGELLDVEKGDLEVVLDGVSEAVYDNTVSIAQLKSVTGQELVRELQNYMASYQGTGDNAVDLGRASQMLKMTRKGYQTQKERREKEMEKTQEKLASGLEFLQEDMEKLRERRDNVSSQEEQLHMVDGEEDGSAILDRRVQAVERKRWGTIFGMALGILLAVGGNAAADILAPQLLYLRVLAGVLGAVIFVVSLLSYKKQSRELNKRRRMKTRWMQKQEKLRWSKENILGELAQRATAYENLQEEYRECTEALGYPSNEDMEIQALNLAMETIDSLSGTIYKRVGTRLKERTSQILSEITGGKYQEVLMDSEFKIKVNTQDRAVALERLSRGTIEQIYFALRMAAGELLCKGEPFPVILDDVFGMYDEDRLGAVLKWIYKEKRQVIISTCHKREMQILEKNGIPFQKILL